jgi:heat shock protein HslJ
MKIWVVVGLLAVLTIAGCGGAEGESARSQLAVSVVEGAWELREGRGSNGRIAVPAGSRVTLVVEHGQAAGTAGCNQYGGAVTINGGRFRLAELSGTEMACQPDVMVAEAAYLSALQAVDRVRVVGENLVLSGGAAELTFVRLPPVPRTALIGSEWRLETIVTGETATNVQNDPTLKLTPAGTLEGSTGCRTFRGRYVVRGGEVVVTQLSALEDPLAGACPEAVVRQEGVVLDVIGDRFQAVVDGDRLTLESRRNALVYRAG